MKKGRLDALLVERGLVADADEARRLIGSGRVLIDDRMGDKPGMLYPADSQIRIRDKKRFVSRGGDKLTGGLRAFAIDPSGMVCADIGCSTGGFTDCLLQSGAKRVYSIDVGYGVLDWRLRQDARVVVLERTNARYLTRDILSEGIDLAVIDASFISLEPLLPPLVDLFRGPVLILALVKPQFQLPRELVGKGGIVRDQAGHEEALAMVRRIGQQLGLHCAGDVASPLQGAKGNQEFFMLLTGPRKACEDFQKE